MTNEFEQRLIEWAYAGMSVELAAKGRKLAGPPTDVIGPAWHPEQPRCYTYWLSYQVVGEEESGRTAVFYRPASDSFHAGWMLSPV